MEIDYIKQSLKIHYEYIIDYYKARIGKGYGHLDPKNKYAFIFFAADYNNLGDVAITLAQKRFLEKCVPDYMIIEVPEGDTYKYIKVIKRLPKKSVLITLIGGGNNGTLYEFLERPRRFVLRCLRRYKIVSFPQSVYFDETPRGIPYKKEFTKLCSRCVDLTLTAREKNSFDTYKSLTKVNTVLTPDIVFSLDKELKGSIRYNNVAAIFRDDKEKLIDEVFQVSIMKCIEDCGYRVIPMDTCDVDICKGRDEEFENYIKCLSSVKLAVTDRLHGMIFSYITRTPCIVLKNNNPKIESTYETWLNNQNFIYLLNGSETLEEIKNIINGLVEVREPLFTDLRSEFLPLYDACKGKEE